MGKININDLEDYLSDDADYEVVQKIPQKPKKSSIYSNINSDKELES